MEQTTPEKITIGSEVGKKVNCSMCQKEGTTDQFIMLQDSRGQSVCLCPECKEKTNKVFEDETKNIKLSRAILFGIIAGAIGGVAWYLFAVVTGMEIGYISLGLGYLVGYGVYFGAGKKRGKKLQIISAILAILSIIVAEKFIFDHYLNEYIQSNLNDFPDILPGQSISVSFFEPLFWENLASPISILIYAIGIYIAYKFCTPRKI